MTSPVRLAGLYLLAGGSGGIAKFRRLKCWCPSTRRRRGRTPLIVAAGFVSEVRVFLHVLQLVSVYRTVQLLRWRPLVNNG